MRGGGMDEPNLKLRWFATSFITMLRIVKTCLLFLVFIALLIAACAVTFPQILSEGFWASFLQ